MHPEELELHKELIIREKSVPNGLTYTASPINGDAYVKGLVTIDNVKGMERCCDVFIKKDQLMMLGEEHSAKMLVSRVDFWLYFLAYFCGGTIGLVYTNNLGQIAQSIGQSSSTSTLITLYSSFSFFGRLLSAAPDVMRT